MAQPQTKGLISNIMGVPRFTAKVATGDRHGAGTTAKIWMQLVDKTGKTSEKTLLDKTFVDDHKRGEAHTYNISHKGLEKPEDIECITITREKSVVDDNWLLDRIELLDTTTKKTRFFPVQRWIAAGKMYYLFEFDAFLPQDDSQKEPRKMELAHKRTLYEYSQVIEGGPKQCANLPEDEKFSEMYLLDIVATKAKLLARQKYLEFTTGEWKTLEDMNNIYVDGSQMNKPECIKYWKEDRWFGLQRVQGVNSVILKLCKAIPDKLAVKDTDLEPFLEGLKLSEALSMNKIFIIDLEVLEGVHTQSFMEKMVTPIGLFYLNKKKDLMPIAIQLFQKPSPTNPVFFPNDPQYTWLLAKMFFNMGEAQQHQSVTHLGLTHLLMETMVISANRQLSPSHPIYRLLAPHFLYLLAINARGIDLLISPGGWVDAVMLCGRDGMFQLIGKTYKSWRLEIDGNVEKQIEERGLLDPNVLPHYPYREDAVPLYQTIRKYATKVVKHFYDSPEKLANDHEVQAWAKEMGTPQAQGGCGVGGVPAKLDTVDQLVEICVAMISTCSLAHASANFQQYDAYGFVPNYPPVLMKMPPTTKKAITEQELMTYIPSKKTTLDTMAITKILSNKGTNSLGNFEVQYLYNPEVVLMADEFRLELKKLSQENKARNQTREFKFNWLDPEFVPNAISI